MAFVSVFPSFLSFHDPAQLPRLTFRSLYFLVFNVTIIATKAAEDPFEAKT